MIWTLALAFAAGGITVLSPCVLPLLPVILTSSVQEGRARPWGVLLGFIGAFSLLTLTLAFLVQSLGLHPDALRWVSAFVLAGFGVLLAIPPLTLGFETLAARGLAYLPADGRERGEGFWGGLGLGSGLGLAWTPCVGPLMASVITLALNQAVNAAAAVTLAFALGTALPMGAVIFGGRALVRRLAWLQTHGATIQRIFGLLLILTALAIVTGADRRIQAQLLTTFPAWERALVGWEPKVRID